MWVVGVVAALTRSHSWVEVGLGGGTQTADEAGEQGTSTILRVMMFLGLTSAPDLGSVVAKS